MEHEHAHEHTDSCGCDHTHEHGPACDHDHGHNHAHHQEGSCAHEHGPTRSHNHAHEHDSACGCDHEHAHGPACNHDHTHEHAWADYSLDSSEPHFSAEVKTVDGAVVCSAHVVLPGGAHDEAEQAISHALEQIGCQLNASGGLLGHAKALLSSQRCSKISVFDEEAQVTPLPSESVRIDVAVIAYAVEEDALLGLVRGVFAEFA